MRQDDTDLRDTDREVRREAAIWLIWNQLKRQAAEKKKLSILSYIDLKTIIFEYCVHRQVYIKLISQSNKTIYKIYKVLIESTYRILRSALKEK